MPKKAIYKKPAAKSAGAKYAVKKPAMQREDAKPIKKPSMKPDGIRCGPTEHLPAHQGEGPLLEDYNPSDEAVAIAPLGWLLEWDFLTEEPKNMAIGPPRASIQWRCHSIQCIV